MPKDYKPKGLTLIELEQLVAKARLEGRVNDDSPVVLDTPFESNYNNLQSVEYNDIYMGGHHIMVIRLKGGRR